LVSVGFASREFLSWSLISRQVKSSVYVGEKVSDFTQPIRSAAGNVDQFLVICSRVRCSLARHQPFMVIRERPRSVLARNPRSRRRSTTAEGGRRFLKNAKSRKKLISPRCRSRSTQERANDTPDIYAPSALIQCSCKEYFMEASSYQGMNVIGMTLKKSHRWPGLQRALSDF
jgi:hypothetical protein